MKIVKLVVTDEDGKEHTYEGTGFVTEPLSQNYHSPQGEYKQVVTAAITLPVRTVKA